MGRTPGPPCTLNHLSPGPAEPERCPRYTSGCAGCLGLAAAIAQTSRCAALPHPQRGRSSAHAHCPLRAQPMGSEPRTLPLPGGRGRGAARVSEESGAGEAAPAGSAPLALPGSCSVTWSPPVARRDRTADSTGRAPGRAAPQPALTPRPEETAGGRFARR